MQYITPTFFRETFRMYGKPAMLNAWNDTILERIIGVSTTTLRDDLKTFFPNDITTWDTTAILPIKILCASHVVMAIAKDIFLANQNEQDEKVFLGRQNEFNIMMYRIKLGITMISPDSTTLAQGYYVESDPDKEWTWFNR